MREYKQIDIGLGMTADAVPEGSEILTVDNGYRYAVVEVRKPVNHPKHGRIEIKIARLITNVNTSSPTGEKASAVCLVRGNAWAGAKVFMIGEKRNVERDFMNEAEAVRSCEIQGI